MIGEPEALHAAFHAFLNACKIQFLKYIYTYKKGGLLAKTTETNKIK